MLWSGNVGPTLIRGRGTIFGTVTITPAEGATLPQQQIWLNDLAELRTSAKGRGIGDRIRSLGRWQPSSEHQKILAELQRISIAILTDSSLFPDPLKKHAKAEKEQDSASTPADTPAADPQQLIRSLNLDDQDTEHTASPYALHGITLTGVLRALFDFGEEELEMGAVEDPDAPAPPGPTPPKHPPTKPPIPHQPPLPPTNARAKLRKDMDQYVRKLAEPEFSSNCSVTQLVQAVAYPLAVVTNGTRGGWIEGSSGEEYVPVEHEDNTYESPEEEDLIARITDELEGLQLRIPGGRLRPLTRADIRVVAPYNLQVRRLERRLTGVAVGTVDKFQGQEAAVVILSMCSSSGDNSPRGKEFLFNTNRLNVALSRAQVLSIVVGHPALAQTACASVEQLRLINLYCRAVCEGTVERRAAG